MTLEERVGISDSAAPQGGAPAGMPDRRCEPREDCVGLKLVLRERRTPGIIHLRNISSWGACGITDMPLAVGSVVFFEIKRSRFQAARVKWVSRMTIGVQFTRQLSSENLAPLLAAKRRRSENLTPL